MTKKFIPTKLKLIRPVFYDVDLDLDTGKVLRLF
jgi:hypothetical protein